MFSRFRQIFFVLSLPLPILALTKIYRENHADEVVSSLISTENWTPYYWGQSRLGSLVPLLASPVTDLSSNMITQNWIHIFLMTVFIIVLSSNFDSIYINKTSWIPALAIIILTFTWWPREYASALPYGDSFALSAVAMLLYFQQKKRPVKKTIAVFLICLANWLNPLVTYYLIPIYLLLFTGKLNRKRETLIHFATSSSIGIFFIFYGIKKGENSGFSLPSMGQFQDLKPYLPLLILQIVNFFLYLFEKKKEHKISLLKSLLITISIWPLIVILSSLSHVRENLYAPRYFIPFSTLGSAILILHFYERIRFSSNLEFNLAVFKKNRLIGVFVLILLNIGSFQSVAKAVPLNDSWMRANQIMNAAMPNPTFVAGDYWYAWPAKILIERPDSLIVLSHRMEGQRLFQDSSGFALRSKLVQGSSGICYGPLKNCYVYLNQIREKMKVSFENRLEFVVLKEYSLPDLEARIVKLKITSQEKTCWDGSELPTQIGESKGTNVVAPLGISGFLTFGPYVGLGPGSYDTFIEYKVEEGDTRKDFGYIDRANIGEQILGSKVYLTNNDSNFHRTKTSFMTETYIPKFELRVFSSGAARIELQQICLIKH